MDKYEGLRPYCNTDYQRELLDTLRMSDTILECAERIGVAERNIYQRINVLKKRAAKQGFSPEHDMTQTTPEGYTVKGVSTYYDENGEVRGQWVKSQQDKDLAEEEIQALIDSFKADIPKYRPGRYRQKKVNKDIIPWFQIGDAHIGMLAHHYEVGHNFDMKIAQKEICVAVGELIDRCEPCERCVIQDMGDFTHYENYAGVTEAGKNQVDYDGRFPKMIDTYVAIMRFIIEAALDKFKYVDIIINQGNHSRTNDIWARKLISEVYDSKRVTAIKNTNVFIPYRMGNTFVMSHHSDKCKPARLASVMAADYRHDFGEAKYKYIDIGHIHTKTVAYEVGDVIIESWNQLAPNEKYAHEAGWRSRSFLSLVYRSKTYGEKGRITVPVEEVKDRIEKLKPGTSAKVRREVHSV